VRLEPVNKWIIAHAAIVKKASVIILPNASKGVSRCYLVESVSLEAAAAGYAPGDFLVARSVYDMFFRGGACHRVVLTIDEVICHARDVRISDFTSIDGKPFEEYLANDTLASNSPANDALAGNGALEVSP
jgi:hypothetical protein